MFEDSLLATNSKMKKRSPWAMFLSFGLQALLIGIAVLIPLIYTEALPKQQLMTMLVAPPPPPPPPPPPQAQTVVQKKAPSNLVNNELMAPKKIPQKIAKIVESDEPPPQASGVVGGLVTSGSGGGIGGVIGGLSNLSAAPSQVQQAPPKVVRVSAGVVTGFLLRRVVPSYPPLARQARVQGPVVLHAIIGKDGAIESLTVISGHPMLQSAAVEAIKQWKYKPYMLNNEPVEVDTTITFNFSLTGD